MSGNAAYLLSSHEEALFAEEEGKMKAQAFKMLNDSKLYPQAVKGSIVYACFCDYGLADDDSRATGVPRKSVTCDPEGGYPFFTVPVADLEPVAGPALE